MISTIYSRPARLLKCLKTFREPPSYTFPPFRSRRRPLPLPSFYYLLVHAQYPRLPMSGGNDRFSAFQFPLSSQYIVLPFGGTFLALWHTGRARVPNALVVPRLTASGLHTAFPRPLYAIDEPRYFYKRWLASYLHSITLQMPIGFLRKGEP